MTLSIISIILAVVAVIVTVIGFFASLKFYREGMNLQSRANDALSKIAEKADSIHSQVGGMFDKTLDAAIGRSSDLKSNFEDINEQIEKTTHTIVNTALKQIGTAGEEERKRLSSVVNEQIGLIRQRVLKTQRSAEQFPEVQMSKRLEAVLREKVLATLRDSKHPLTLEEMAKLTEMDKRLIGGMDRRLLGHVLYTLSQENLINIGHDSKTKMDVFSPNPIFVSPNHKIASESEK